jgi:hypothetical protein
MAADVYSLRRLLLVIDSEENIHYHGTEILRA